MKFIKKIFIKNYENTADSAVRFRYGKTAGIIGIISNSVLCGLKLAIGILGSSITIIADAVNNLADAGSSVVTLVGFKLSGRPADKQHPYGHARYEYITALLVALIVLVIGVLLCKSSIEKILSPEAVTVNVFTYAVLGSAIVVKIFQMLLYLDFAKSISSPALKASAADSRNDVITTFAVLIATVIIDIAGVNIDGYMGAAVSLFIIISSVKLIKETIDPLLGAEPNKELVAKIKEKVLSYDGVIGIHDLMVHSYGEGVSFAIAHVEVPADSDMMICHDLIDNIEHEVHCEFGVHLNLHVDPIDTADEELEELKTRACRVLKELDEGLSLHDFRIVRGVTHSNILFDVVVPFDCSKTLYDVTEAMEKEFENDAQKYFFVLDMDR